MSSAAPGPMFTAGGALLIRADDLTPYLLSGLEFVWWDSADWSYVLTSLHGNPRPAGAAAWRRN